MNELTVVDSKENKISVIGEIKGFVIKKPRSGSFGHIIISGLDDTWMGKRVLCVLLDGEEDNGDKR